MKKIIPFNSSDEKRKAPAAPATLTPTQGAALAGVPAWHDGTEQQLLLLQRVIGCTDQQLLIERLYRWALDLNLADGVSFSHEPSSLVIEFGARRHHTAQYELNLDQRPLGSITLCRRERYSENDLLAIEQALGSIARCLLVAQDMAALKSRATQDPLTGLGNRRSMEHWLTTELSRSRRHSSPLSVMMIDVDHFKEINDSLGHLGGDRVLKTIARVLERGTRGSDLVFRYGGDEFAVLLPHTDLEGAENTAAQIRQQLNALSNQDLGLDDSITSRPDISIGIASCHGDDDEKRLLERADRHLYHAKALGRGRACSRV
ncbi:MAG: GGDEF domain-containing protein [Congregibacter sp.]